MKKVKKQKDRIPVPENWDNTKQNFIKYVAHLDPKRFAVALRRHPKRFIYYAPDLLTKGHWKCIARNNPQHLFPYHSEKISLREIERRFRINPAMILENIPEKLTEEQFETAKKRNILEVLHYCSQMFEDEDFVEYINLNLGWIQRALRTAPNNNLINRFIQLPQNKKEQIYSPTIKHFRDHIVSKI